ncbi:ABC transporter substrate-binding protein [Microbacterium betulae]|uniref:Thiamine pyrimidine synthase n=1 Tax=Microbacterium betulae TaxID=2981139 RepID=A0AA97FIG0_9MICO|nr:ABC transporter substrate-binding protein [Microbacterium sp. AB]WOF22117.1 ABC transporter substrate-binding protein [Microbacterium sp. AB]
MPHPRGPRAARALGALTLAGALVASLASCASSGTAEEGSADYGDITVQLSWLKNHEFSGYFEADRRGYFEEAGFADVELVAGGIGGVPAATALTSGSAWVGIASPSDVAQANAEGADLRIVATTYQKNPFTLVSADSDPIETPADLVGKTIAVADSSATNWEAFLAANDIDPDDVDRVPYGDAQNDLKLGNIDGFMGYGDGGAPLRATGFGAQEFLLADYGLAYSGEAVVVTAETLANEADEVEAFLTAYARGWKDAFDDVDGTIDLVVDDYGKDQNYAREDIELSWEQQERLILTDESLENGIGTISDDAVQRNIDSLALVGYDVAEEDLFDTSLIADVYAERPELVIGAE